MLFITPYWSVCIAAKYVYECLEWYSVVSVFVDSLAVILLSSCLCHFRDHIDIRLKHNTATAVPVSDPPRMGRT